MRIPCRVRSAAVIFAAATSLATTVLPPELDHLVAQSECVVRATVLSTHCEWRTSEAHRTIVTIVSLRVDEAIVGHVPATIALEFLGGEIDGEGLSVAGQPQFAPGDEDILFVAGNGRQICPLVAMMYGRFLIARDDAGRALVARSNGVPLTAVAELAQAMAAGPAATILQRVKHGQNLGSAEFCAAIRECARQQGRADVGTP